MESTRPSSSETITHDVSAPPVEAAQPVSTRLTYPAYFCPEDVDPFTQVSWHLIDVVLKDGEGNIIFEQKGVEAPVRWSERAVRIVAQKYFRGRLGTPEREYSVKQIVGRVADTIFDWVQQQHYFETKQDAWRFRNDLIILLLEQKGSFNSPVWFNLGVKDTLPQVSACFIQSVEDNMQSIAELQMGETLIFKRGSGTGTNFSNLRSKKEHLAGGGTASGPVSFMRGLDAWAGVIKSGGKTRRAAKMAILNIDHPDILEFIDCKLKEEERAQELAKAGYSTDFDDADGAYASVCFQNANHAIRVTDDFMHLVQRVVENPSDDPLWELRARTTGEVIDRVPVRTLWNKICEASYVCGDPGMQFDTTTNKWHTCPSDGRINATNPCSEFAFLDDTSCNLASLNLLAFTGNTSTAIFNTEDFQKAVSVFIIAQDAMVSQAFYPTERIAEATKKYRALGLGYTNLGAFLMAQGLAYDSTAARALTSEITSLMTATAYLTSAKISAVLGPFEAYERNRPAMERVIKQHRDEAYRHRLQSVEVWDRAIKVGEVCGYRNAQTTLIAPTGTISFMMDCDTTGCEPEISLYKVKKLVGGGSVVLENRIVDQALKTLGYSEQEREGMLRYLGENKTLEGCSWLRSQHWPVFDCAVPAAGKRTLSLAAHLDMMMAIQPFISGAISKTVNMAASATAEDIGKAFFNAWLNGIKNIIIYRNKSKLSQPIESKKATPAATTFIPDPTPVRRKLRDHQNNCHRIKIEFGQVEGYLVATPYEDTGMPGEIFVVLSKEGSTISGLVDGWATSVSLCLQYGVPLEKLVDKFSHAKFEPSGFSGDPDIRHASSIYDALIRKLAAVFIAPAAVPEKIEEIKFEKPFAVVDGVMERPICTVCGSITQQNGATCYVCPVCGNGTGCS